MSGKVFISCGQRPPDEKNIAEKIARLLKEKFELNPYLAFKIQSLTDIMRITDELRSSDYYLIIDFGRKDPVEYPNSLFTHQELALAYHLGFNEIIAFQQKGAPLQGFLKYLQANPETFEKEEELLKKIEELVHQRGWNKGYSRNLVISDLQRVGPFDYGDHTGKQFEYIWQVRVDNKRFDMAAKDAECVLDYIVYPDGRKEDSYDRNFLKWAATSEYRRTILPKDYGKIDAFSIHINEEGIYLHSTRDNRPRYPVIKEEGIYLLHYKLFAEHFPLVEFDIKVDYKHTSQEFSPVDYRKDLIRNQEWQNGTAAILKITW